MIGSATLRYGSRNSRAGRRVNKSIKRFRRRRTDPLPYAPGFANRTRAWALNPSRASSTTQSSRRPWFVYSFRTLAVLAIPQPQNLLDGLLCSYSATKRRMSCAVR